MEPIFDMKLDVKFVESSPGCQVTLIIFTMACDHPAIGLVLKWKSAEGHVDGDRPVMINLALQLNSLSTTLARGKQM